MIGQFNLPQTVGRSYQLLVSGRDAKWKPAGVTFDWSTVTALGADTTIPDGVTYAAGTKVLLPGTVVVVTTSLDSAGVYDPAATDGRQTLERGRVFLVNDAVVEKDSFGRTRDQFGVLEGGLIWKARLVHNGTSAGVKGKPKLADLEAVLPLLRYAQ